MDILTRAGLTEKYRSAKKRLVLLDYDGTLVDYTPLPETTRLSEHLFDILIRLAENPGTAVYIITGRRCHDVDKIMNHLPADINIIAEHGAFIRERGIWLNKLSYNTSWKEKIKPVFNQITSLCPGSFVEEKSYSLSWHYRNTVRDSGFARSRELITALEKITKTSNLKILDGNKVVEVMIREVGKGISVKRLYEQNNYDFILSIGDDVTDEEMFEYLLHIPGSFTIKVGRGESSARYKLQGINDVILLLKHLSA
jgi:trehalose 6-phosphate synthase/phosphatase